MYKQEFDFLYMKRSVSPPKQRAKKKNPQDVLTRTFLQKSVDINTSAKAYGINVQQFFGFKKSPHKTEKY